MSGGAARGRLAEERRSWRKSHPYGFVAKPKTDADGTVNLMVWNCIIPGKPDGWKPAITVRQILLGVQDLLDQPNPESPAQHGACNLFTQNPAEYKRRVQKQAKNYPSTI